MSGTDWALLAVIIVLFLLFLRYLPVIALAFVGGWFFVPKSRDPDQGKLDPIGASHLARVALAHGPAIRDYGQLHPPV